MSARNERSSLASSSVSQPISPQGVSVVTRLAFPLVGSFTPQHLPEASAFLAALSNLSRAVEEKRLAVRGYDSAIASKELKGVSPAAAPFAAPQPGLNAFSAPHPAMFAAQTAAKMGWSTQQEPQPLGAAATPQSDLNAPGNPSPFPPLNPPWYRMPGAQHQPPPGSFLSAADFAEVQQQLMYAAKTAEVGWAMVQEAQRQQQEAHVPPQQQPPGALQVPPLNPPWYRMPGAQHQPPPGAFLSAADFAELQQRQIYAAEEAAAGWAMLEAQRQQQEAHAPPQQQHKAPPGGKPPRGTSLDAALRAQGWSDSHDGMLTRGTPLCVDSQAPGSVRLAAFDMDDTLITTKSGSKYPTSEDDWKWLHPSVPRKLQAISATHTIVIISNQATVERLEADKRALWVLNKIIALEKVAGVPIAAAVAFGEKYRKPSPLLMDVILPGWATRIDYGDSIFVGDAAGRKNIFSTLAGRAGDFACSDRKFAFNTGLNFYTPEEWLFGPPSAPVPFDWGSGESPDLLRRLKALRGDQKPNHRPYPELVVLVGPPGSGKSTYFAKHFAPHGYVHINRDTQQVSLERLVEMASAALKAGRSVCVDNTNPSAKTRQLFLAAAQEHSVPARIISLTTPFDIAAHLNKARALLGLQVLVPRIATDIYTRNLELPNLEGADRGFTSIEEAVMAIDDDVLQEMSVKSGHDARRLVLECIFD